MLKKLPKSLKNLRNAGAIAIGGILGTLVLAALASYFLILPAFTNLGELEEINEADRATFGKIQSNVTILTGLDKQKIATLSATVDGLMPPEPDQTRVAALVSVVAQAAGGRITSLQGSANSAKSKTTAKAPPSGAAASGTTSTTPITKAGASSATKTASYTLEIQFVGSYQALRRFIVGLRSTDRAIEVAGLTVAPDEIDPNGVKVTTNLKFPLSTSAVTVTPEEPITFSAGLQKEIEELAASIQYEVEPTNLPTSRPNPFRGY